MRDIISTIYGASILNNLVRGRAVELLPYTTINEALYEPLVVPNQPAIATMGMHLPEPYNPLTDSTGLSIGYIVIGIGGHRHLTGADNGLPYTSAIDHTADNSGLYRMTPFAIKPVSNDLTDLQRRRYRLRKTMLIGGELYAAYYARKITVEDSAPELTRTVIANGVATTTPFVPTMNNLRPPSPALGVANDGSSLAVESPLSFEFTLDDIALYKEAAAILYGSEDYAVISEIAVCIGADKVVTQVYPVTGTQTPALPVNPSLLEAVGVTMMSVLSCHRAVAVNNEAFVVDFDMGTSLPLFGQAITTG